MLEAGDSLPAFSLAAHDDSTVDSADLGGSPYLLYFYPRADTPGCTKEACTLRDAWEDLEAAGLPVFGVSFDSPEVNRAFAEKYELPFLLLSDSDHKLARAVGAKVPFVPLPKRVSYLVGPDGRVLVAYPEVSPGYHARQVLEDFSGS